jgi:hypothetical protein
MVKEDKYEKIIGILRKAKPDLTDPGAFSDEVIRKIRQKSQKVSTADILIDYLFSWISVGWLRRSLTAAAAIIVSLFVIQQSLILRKVSELSSKAVYSGAQLSSSTSRVRPESIFLFNRVEKGISGKYNKLTEKEIDEFVESFNDLQERYRDVISLINEDPVLKKYVEEKLSEKNSKKPKL